MNARGRTQFAPTNRSKSLINQGLFACFLNSNSNRNGHTNHRVVTCSNESHHLYVSGNGRRACKLSVTVHSTINAKSKSPFGSTILLPQPIQHSIFKRSREMFIDISLIITAPDFLFNLRLSHSPSRKKDLQLTSNR